MIPNLAVEDFLKRLVEAVPATLRPKKVSYSSSLDSISKIRDGLSERAFEIGKFWSILVWNREVLSQSSRVNRSFTVRLDGQDDPVGLFRNVRSAEYRVNFRYLCNSMVAASLFEMYLWTDFLTLPSTGLFVPYNLNTHLNPGERVVEVPYSYESESLGVSTVENLSEGNGSSLYALDFSLLFMTTLFGPSEQCIPKILEVVSEVYATSDPDALIEDLRFEQSIQPVP